MAGEEAGLEEAGMEPRSRNAEVKEAVVEPFEPRIESSLPDGFPPPGVLGHVAIKEYPAARLAEIETGLPRARGLLFLRLFRHVQENRLAMTSPVLIGTPWADGGGMDSMAFFYRSTAIGRTGAHRMVRVRDIEPVTVASIGLRGEYTVENFRRGLARLED